MSLVAGSASIYLASRSPRRRELLNADRHRVRGAAAAHPAERGADVNEEPLPGEPPRDYVVRVCRDKAEGGWMRVMQRKLPLRAVLAADTTVCIGDEILGKPADAAAGRGVARAPVGAQHEVLTAVALKFGERMEAGCRRPRCAFARSAQPRSSAMSPAANPSTRPAPTHPGPRRRVHRRDPRQLFRRDGPAAVRDRAAAARIGSPA